MMKESNLTKCLTMATAALAFLAIVGMGRARNSRGTGGKLFSQFVYFSLLASSLLLISLATQAQDASKQQDQLLTQESGFLGDYYSKLQPDPDNADLLTYWQNADVLKNSSKFILNPVIVYLLPEASWYYAWQSQTWSPMAARKMRA
jgi:hypothetical protein